MEGGNARAIEVIIECPYFTDCLDEYLTEKGVPEKEREEIAEDNASYYELLKEVEEKKCSVCPMEK